MRRTTGPWLTTLPQCTIQNHEAVGRLHAQYGAYRAAGIGRKSHPWTTQAMLEMGRLFVEAYGQAPPASYLKAAYGMPEFTSMARLFGSLQAYHLALAMRAQEVQT